ncbi:Wzz/FepE/Etk N-terminal domain-containing protein [Psychrobium sp. MM17-31]|uniref:Wzz/FepE/Etk N-terminal domain-containing protein n=1 Tax=Psychrobium sp. MM17-31 TaxID=2917758 RepID=UPI001EF6A4BF|nr:Wzz/FepE/Etk N-terminal domain-containing protein [Psychrobium sp. MM17-31]MCG7531161.1 Wzz/FepE/Etk N-terminal domain-containing protein [Psychrobium sp. MM17-31]
MNYGDKGNELYQQWLAMQTSQSEKRENEVDLIALWQVIWSEKWLVCTITFIFAISSVIYALSLPNVYKSEALLVPATEEQNSLGGLASQFGGLASLAGVNLGGAGGIDKTNLAIEIIKSRIFITRFIEQNDLLIPLMATKGWDPQLNKLIYDSDAYNTKTGKWLRNGKGKPSAQEAYIAFRALVDISLDEKSSLIHLSVKHYSPYLAKEWVDELLYSINLEMKNRALSESEKSISYLKLQLKQTNLKEIKNVLYQIIEEQTKTIMFAEIREQFAFKTIDPALVPELKSGPKRAIICIAGTFLGGMLSVMIVLIRYVRKKK